MKRLLGTLTVILMIGTSQASTSLNGIVGSNKNLVYVAQRPTVIRSVPVRVKIQKPKLFVSRPHSADDWDDLDADDVITGYRRRDLNKIEHQDGISEQVRWKLFLARQLALLKYRELHG